ncbi:MAG: hypothetical protein R3C97_06285 [Geminicoccaceae bacterium]
MSRFDDREAQRDSAGRAGKSPAPRGQHSAVLDEIAYIGLPKEPGDRRQWERELEILARSGKSVARLVGGTNAVARSRNGRLQTSQARPVESALVMVADPVAALDFLPVGRVRSVYASYRPGQKAHSNNCSKRLAQARHDRSRQRI